MSEKKNTPFENAWEKYSNKITRKRMEKFLPGIARLFSSGNKMQAELEFNAEMLSALNGTSLNANELAWAAAGKVPSKTMTEIFSDKTEGSNGSKIATKKLIGDLGSAANSFFSSNPDAYSEALNYTEKVKSFLDQGYSADEAKMYAVPVEKFKAFNKGIDAKAQYKYAGKDNDVHSVSQDFHDRSVMPKDDEIVTGDLVEKQDSDKKTLAKMLGGKTSEIIGDEANLDNLETYAKELGFVDSDALLSYLVQSYDRSNRLKEQENDGPITTLGKNILLDQVNSKWDEGVPASTTDVVHDAALFALETAPQGKAVGMLGKVIKNAAPKSRAILKAENAMASPWVQYIGRKSYLPAEAAFLDNALNGKQEGIDWADIAGQTAGNASLDIGLTGALRGLYRLPLFKGAPQNFLNGTFLSGDKKLAQNLEKRAYEMALEAEAGQAAHNIMLRSNPDSRANSLKMYEALSKNKNFRKGFNLGDEAFDRVFNDAWDSAKHADAATVGRASRSLRKALKNIDTYKKTKDFENALQSAAWVQAGYKGPNPLNRVRDGLYNFNIGLENVDAATQAKLIKKYDDYARKRKGLDKMFGFLKYEGIPGLFRFGENVASVNRIYGPLYGQMLRGFGIKQDNNEK